MNARPTWKPRTRARMVLNASSGRPRTGSRGSRHGDTGARTGSSAVRRGTTTRAPAAIDSGIAARLTFTNDQWTVGGHDVQRGRVAADPPHEPLDHGVVPEVDAVAQHADVRERPRPDDPQRPAAAGAARSPPARRRRPRRVSAAACWFELLAPRDEERPVGLMPRLCRAPVRDRGDRRTRGSATRRGVPPPRRLVGVGARRPPSRSRSACPPPKMPSVGGQHLEHDTASGAAIRVVESRRHTGPATNSATAAPTSARNGADRAAEARGRRTRRTEGRCRS